MNNPQHTDIARRIEDHLKALSPHIRERKTALLLEAARGRKTALLLEEALEEIKALRGKVQNRSPMAEAMNVASNHYLQKHGHR